MNYSRVVAYAAPSNIDSLLPVDQQTRFFFKVAYCSISENKTEDQRFPFNKTVRAFLIDNFFRYYFFTRFSFRLENLANMDFPPEDLCVSIP